MKKLVLFVFICSLVTPALASNGSFLILKSAYLYQTQTQKGQKTLTRQKKAYDVTEIHMSPGPSLMFRIRLPEDKIELNDSGFIVETESELKSLGIKKVKVYPKLPVAGSDLTDFHLVPSNHLSFTGKTLISPGFPKLSWKAVNFKTSMPSEVWVPEWAGIYRPNKNAAWLNRTYREVTSQKLDKILEEKILTGQVEIGFTREQVRMALGEPDEERRLDDNTTAEWIYPGHKIIFLKGIVNRVL